MATIQNKRDFVSSIARTHGHQLRRFLAARMRYSPGDVQDLMQEIYLRLLRLKDPHAVRNIQAYLYTIASHVLHQYMLRRSNVPQAMDPIAVVQALDLQQDIMVDPAEEAEVEQRIEAAGHALERHSPRAFVTFVMYRCQGLTFKEIGTRLGVSSVMARKYLMSAIRYFDAQLNKDDEEE